MAMKRLGDLKKGDVVRFKGDLYEIVGFNKGYVQLRYISTCGNKKTGWKNNSLVKYLNSLTSEDTVKSWYCKRME